MESHFLRKFSAIEKKLTQGATLLLASLEEAKLGCFATSLAPLEKNNNQLVIPIFHSDFDALQVLPKRFGKIPPHGDFGDFLVAACALAIFS